jgi:hypothetical protein
MYKRNGFYTNITTDSRRNLVITLNKEAFEEWGDLLSQDKGDYNTFYELLEEHLTNGLEWINPDDLGAMTDAPILSDVVERDEDNKITSCDYVWWYPNYQVSSPLDELKENGRVIFTYNGKGE